jgi:poly(beta-D-mannuronate) C5 epimerase
MPVPANRVRVAGARHRRAGHSLPAALAIAAAAVSPVPGATPPATSEPQSAPRYEVVRLEAGVQVPTIASALPALDGFTVEAVRAMTPDTDTGRTARVESIDRLYFLHSSNIMEMDKVWAERKRDEPTCIVLGRGSYSLESVRRQIDDPAVLSREEDGSYLLSRPIYIAPTGVLTVAGGKTLRLSANEGTFIYSNGTLVVVDSELVAWDTNNDAPSRRRSLEKKSVLYYAQQEPRPYILASKGSKTYLAGSTFRGLGYKGTSGTFGISFTPSAGGGRLADHVRRLSHPTGWIVGNRIIDLFFGFYSNQAEDVAILGNLFSENVVYAIDPHDYSRRLIVARNVAQGSSFAHGVIFSRGVRDSWVVENVAIANGGSGIMMDRSSTDNLIADNLVFGNRGDGIAIFESDRNLLRGNTVTRNLRNGILLRNSTDIQVLRNTMSRNGRSGVELASADISELETRDFDLDPFLEHASALVQDNSFHDKLRSAVAMQAGNALTLHANRYPQSGPLYFDGDLTAHARELLAAELGSETPVLVRRTNPAASGASRNDAAGSGTAPARKPNALLGEHARRGVPVAMLGLARYYTRERDDVESWRRGIYWYGRAIRHARVSAMSELGIALVAGVGRTGTERREGLVLLSMASRRGDLRAREDLALLPDMLGTTEAELAGARRRAAQRLSTRKLWNAQAFPDVRIELDRDEIVEAERRVSHLFNEPRAEKPRRSPRRDRKRRERYEERVAQKNTRRERLNERLREDRLANARARGERRANLDRVDRRERAAELRSRTYTPDEWRAQRAEVANMLEAVNRHRASEDPLSIDAIMLPERLTGSR